MMARFCRAEDPRPSISLSFSKLLECPKGRSDAATEIDEEPCRTPTAEDCRIPALLTCPPAPRKRRAKEGLSRIQSGRVKEFFVAPPNLDLIFSLEKVSRVN